MRPQFVLSEMFTGLRRNVSMTVSLVLVTMVSFTFLGLGLMSSLQSRAITGYWDGKVEVLIALCPARSDVASCSEGEATQAQKAAISAQLDSLKPLVEKVYFETKDEAYKHFTEQFKDSAIRGAVQPDQMQESYRVKLSDPKKYEVIASAFSGAPGVELVNDQRQILAKLFSFLKWMTVAGWAFAGATTVAAVLLVATAVRLSAFNRRREIGIMRLVGASNLFIQFPFILEAILATLLGAGIAVVLLYVFAVKFLQGWLAPEIAFIPFIGGSQVLEIAPLLLGVAMAVAVFTSFFTMRRYLRV
jgi:cell division transport system permease protein